MRKPKSKLQEDIEQETLSKNWEKYRGSIVIRIHLLNQKGFSQIAIILAVLALLSIGFYAGRTSPKPLVSNLTELLQSPEPSVSPTVQSKLTSTPKSTTKASSVPAANPTSKPSTIPLPIATPAPVQPSNNTSDSNAPTFIKVTAPNGGESFRVGDTMHITWSSNNLYKSGSCVITLAYDNGSKSSAWVPVNTPNGYFDWKLTSESGGKQAKVDMQCYDSGSNGYNDQSDNYFTVAN